MRKSAASLVYQIAIKTPLEPALHLSQQLGCQVYMKREDLQPVHSFKLRGAYNKMAQLSKAERHKGVIAASAGNHAQGVALSAKKLGVSALIIMPRTTPDIKVTAVRSHGAEVILTGDSFTDAYEYCLEQVAQTGRTFIHPFDDPDVIAGQGTIGTEILEQLPDVTHLFVPVGGGGLLAGVAQVVKAARPEVVIVGVEPLDSNAMSASLATGERVYLDHVGIFADGVAVKQVGVHTFAAAQQYVDDCITVTTDQLCAALKDIYEETRTVVEPAGALGLAGLRAYSASHHMQDAHAVVLCTGANMAFEKLQFVAERTLLGSGKETLLAVQLPEKPHALLRLCETAIVGFDITQFGYRLRDRNMATILVGLNTGVKEARQVLFDQLHEHQYTYTDLSGDDLSKEHIRHMVGGPAPNARDEHFYGIHFPERPGALKEFLRAIRGEWNISLFHYRGLGGDEGLVLVGFEAADPQQLERALSDSGYRWKCCDNDPSLQAFIG